MSLKYLKDACEKCNSLVTEEARQNYIEDGGCPLCFVDVYLKSGQIVKSVNALCDLGVVTDFDTDTMCLQKTTGGRTYINATDIIGIHIPVWNEQE